MKRGLVLGALVAVGILSAAVSGFRLKPEATVVKAAASQPPPSAAAIQAERIKDNLYLLRGGGIPVQIGNLKLTNAGNTLAFITATGVVLVDTKLPGWGKPIIDKLKEITTIDDFVGAWTIPDRFLKEGYFAIDPQIRSLRPEVEAIWNETK